MMITTTTKPRPGAIRRPHKAGAVFQTRHVALAFGLLLAAAAAPAEHVHDTTAVQPHPAAPAAQRQPLYWYDPMHPQYRSDKPGTAPDCGMELVPMYDNAIAGPKDLPPGTVQISTEKQQLTGIRTAAVERRTFTETLHTLGIVQVDESRIHKVHTKFPGWVDKLFIGFTGQPVHAGDPIMAIYSPDLVSTQAEYLIALRGERQLQGSPFAEAANNSQTLLDAARRRLLLWDISAQQIRALEESGKPQTAVTLHSPVSGFITVKDVYQGLYVTPEMTLYTVADLSEVWVLLDVYEYQIASVQVGAPVTLSLTSYPGKTFTGTIAYVYPYLDPKTRTNKVRVQLHNPDLELKPDMFANADIHVPFANRLTVPESAILDSGTQQVAFVASGNGYFEPRQVRIGQRTDGYVEVLDGLSEGQQVVVAANFMVDSESQLKAALTAISGNAADATKETPSNASHQH